MAKLKSQMNRAEMIEYCVNHIPDLHKGAYRRKYLKAMSGKSMRAAVNAKCLDCMNWQSTEVKLCPSMDCPLWPYRPYQGGKNTEAATESTEE